VRDVEAAAEALPSSGAGDGALVAALDVLLAALPAGDAEALSLALAGALLSTHGRPSTLSIQPCLY